MTDSISAVVRTMHLRRAKHQVGERQGIKSFDFLNRPIVPERNH